MERIHDGVDMGIGVVAGVIAGRGDGRNIDGQDGEDNFWKGGKVLRV